MSAEQIVVTPTSGKDLLARVRPRLKVGTTGLCLRPDLMDAWDAANEELTEQFVEDAGKTRLAGKQNQSRAAIAKAKKVKAIEDEIEATEIRFTMRGLDKPAFRLLKDNNPPREGNHIDLYAGYNTEGVRDALVRECLIDPVFEDCELMACNHEQHDESCEEGCVDHGDCGSWQAFLLVCNPSEWEELQRLCEEVNGRAGGLPKSELAARLLERRSTARNSPANGE